MADPPAPFAFTPIGVLRSPHREKFDAPRQPRAALGVEGVIELHPGRGFEDAVADLAGFRHVWVLGVFDRDPAYRPKVRPPRSRTKRGVFATRSPHRPNPISLSVFELVAVDGLSLRVRNVDMLDGTPILDLKPYVAWTDAVVDTSSGWLEDEAKEGDPGPHHEVRFEPEAEVALGWLRDAGLEVEDKVRAALALGSAPHAYRRIKPDGDGFVLSYKDLRFRFVAKDGEVRVLTVDSGYRERELQERPELDLHRRLRARYRSGTP